jgi:homocysteine S-methyltransferase
MTPKRVNLFNGMEKSVVILDGGLVRGVVLSSGCLAGSRQGQGTTLESISKTQIANTPLWSAEALSKEPEAVVGVHLTYLQAGAQIIETST